MMYRITHLGETIGYCFASDGTKAIQAFRKAHNIPTAIILVAERV